MLYTSTVTQKGQVTIPQDIRKKLGLKPYEKVAFVVEEGTVMLKRPPKDFLSLKGSLKSKKKFSDEEADKAIRDSYAKKKF